MSALIQNKCLKKPSEAVTPSLLTTLTRDRRWWHIQVVIATTKHDDNSECSDERSVANLEKPELLSKLLLWMSGF